MLHHKLIFTSIFLIGSVVPCHAQSESRVSDEKSVFTDFVGKPIPGGALLIEKIRLLRTSLTKEIGTPFADNPSQCAAIAVGARACGGPENYLVYSRKVSNEKKIQDIASRYTEADREWNRLSKAISICSMVEAPEIALVDGVCVARNKSNFQIPAPTK